MNLINLVVVAIATWRLTHMLVWEDGPFDVFSRIRLFLGVRYDEQSVPYGEGFFGNLFTCIWCMSVWVGTFFAICIIIDVDIATIIALPFALSGFTVIAQTYMDK